MKLFDFVDDSGEDAELSLSLVTGSELTRLSGSHENEYPILKTENPEGLVRYFDAGTCFALPEYRDEGRLTCLLTEDWLVLEKENILVLWRSFCEARLSALSTGMTESEALAHAEAEARLKAGTLSRILPFDPRLVTAGPWKYIPDDDEDGAESDPSRPT